MIFKNNKLFKKNEIADEFFKNDRLKRLLDIKFEKINTIDLIKEEIKKREKLFKLAREKRFLN